MAPEEIDGCVGRYGKVPQSQNCLTGPYWYGKVVELDSSRKAVRFQVKYGTPGRWYPVERVILHPLKEGDA